MQDGTEMRIVTDLSWINYENLGPLKGHLLRTGEIRVVGRRNAPVCFFILHGDIGFTNQDPRGTMMFNNPEERLLALFRLWNAMNYYFPHLDNLDVSWNDLLTRFVPKMLEGTYRQSYEGGFTPEGGHIHGVGLAPDIRVERTIQGIADGRDEIMEAAVRFILEGR